MAIIAVIGGLVAVAVFVVASGDADGGAEILTGRELVKSMLERNLREIFGARGYASSKLLYRIRVRAL